MMSIPISLLPWYVVMLLRLGKAAISQEYWATEDIERFKINYNQVSQMIIIENR